MNLPLIKSNAIALGIGLFHFSLILFSLWLCFALWIQQPFGKWFTPIIIVLWLLFITLHFKTIPILLICSVSLIWYFNIPALQNRHWSPEVARLISVEQKENLFTIHNVRNFDWYPNGQYKERWETRTYDLNQITGVNIITSYWMGPQIAHTLVSFNFANQRPLVFSIEIRKEKNERFSALGGFFRQFELSLIAADEKDILYTRSNIRHEDVYFFPIKLPKHLTQELFLQYIDTAKDLAHHPRWYNTLTSNCTTMVFDMVQTINQESLPKDYRILLSGYIPNYLYDRGVLSHKWKIQQWYQKAYINPKVKQNQSSEEFSKAIRKDLL